MKKYPFSDAILFQFCTIFYFPIASCRIASHRVVSHKSNRNIQWLALVSLAVLYNIIFVVGRAVFWEINRNVPALWWTLDYLCDAIYIIDILVHCHEGKCRLHILINSFVFRTSSRNLVLERTQPESVNARTKVKQNLINTTMLIIIMNRNIAQVDDLRCHIKFNTAPNHIVA